MLVLSRRIGESVVLPNDQVKIQVLDIRGNKVRLGFEAPDETEIHREEVWSRMVGKGAHWQLEETFA